ncbi:MAG: hypothetical protein PHE68_03905, partial [Candidatus Peribacteraceae bacterium]|nr:hypothetical protein [Candidatus Peribacteraceae bacterium]
MRNTPFRRVVLTGGILLALTFAFFATTQNRITLPLLHGLLTYGGGTNLLNCGTDSKIVVFSDTNTQVNYSTWVPSVRAWTGSSLWTANIPGATWIWRTTNVTTSISDLQYDFRNIFTIPPGRVTNSRLTVAADNQFRAYVNFAWLNETPLEGTLQREVAFTPAGVFQQGENTVTLIVKNLGVPGSTPQTNPAGLLFRLEVCYKPAQAFCGNGLLDSDMGELCEDSNTASGDGCS